MAERALQLQSACAVQVSTELDVEIPIKSQRKTDHHILVIFARSLIPVHTWGIISISNSNCNHNVSLCKNRERPRSCHRLFTRPRPERERKQRKKQASKRQDLEEVVEAVSLFFHSSLFSLTSLYHLFFLSVQLIIGFHGRLLKVGIVILL